MQSRRVNSFSKCVVIPKRMPNRGCSSLLRGIISPQSLEEETSSKAKGLEDYFPLSVLPVVIWSAAPWLYPVVKRVMLFFA
jgi:hypothetical protein